ncbi:hypothetical protein [Lysobacter enzymogenes]|jgi:hypothetical protein|uniref:Uncharacterized protein n=1 Tax=Lysobacter enzymogenes TaxID=69 RepID=A0AAU9AMT1_LYSEN|nr:hypothetical protein [Lysobacter enzymogenes]BAV97388.1 conserved hypothetical protein [Lysobacter enzymogenes]SDW88177.1 hypothetical protein SAMN05421681_103105 [Lysobacter enzymogenes]
MHRILLAALLATAATVGAGIAPAHAGLFDKNPDQVAQDAVTKNLHAVTLWVDATWGFRNQGAANALSRAHQAFATRGYDVVSVEPYIENGDLQGFFVTYQKPRG